MTTPNDRGFVAIEWVAAVGLLMLPVVVLVATLPVWAERRHAATVAAREAVREVVREWPAVDPEHATLVAREVVSAHGIDAIDITVRFSSVGGGRGSTARVEVDIVMPAIAVMGVRAGAWHYTSIATRRVDDYRSR